MSMFRSEYEKKAGELGQRSHDESYDPGFEDRAKENCRRLFYELGVSELLQEVNQYVWGRRGSIANMYTDSEIDLIYRYSTKSVEWRDVGCDSSGRAELELGLVLGVGVVSDIMGSIHPNREAQSYELIVVRHPAVEEYIHRGAFPGIVPIEMTGIIHALGIVPFYWPGGELEREAVRIWRRDITAGQIDQDRKWLTSLLASICAFDRANYLLPGEIEKHFGENFTVWRETNPLTRYDTVTKYHRYVFQFESGSIGGIK